MSNLYDKMVVDEVAAKEGVDFIYFGGAVVIKLAHSPDVKAYGRALEADLAPYRATAAYGTMDEEVSAAILRKRFAEHIILSWSVRVDVKDEDGTVTKELVSGVDVNEDGTVVPDSLANRAAQLQKVPRLFKDLLKQADELDNFSRARTAVAVKN